MTGFFWNVRGTNKFSKHSVIRQWVNNGSMQFGCLLETRVREGKASRIVSSIFQGWSFLSNYETHRLGRIWVVWRDNVRVTPVFKSDQMITCSVLLEGKEEEFFCSFIYAANLVDERKKLWEDMRYHHDSPMFRSKPWMLCGDFNEILTRDEQSNLLGPSSLPGMRDFQDVVRYCSLVDLGYHGPQFTWGNKRENGLICKKLDRMLVNNKWMDNFPNSYCVFEPGGCSDHLRGRFSLENATVGKRKPFKFVNALATLPQFNKVIGDFWETTKPLFLSTSAMFRLSKKLKSLKPTLRVLQKDKLNDLSRRTREAHEDLCSKQAETLLNPSQTNMTAEASAYVKWNHLADLEERYLKQKAKINWLKVGDQNNSYFYRTTQIRKMQNSIREIVNQHGEILTTSEDIKQEAERFFKDFLTYVPSDHRGMSFDELDVLLEFRCPATVQEQLVKEVSDEEIKKVLFGMPNDKSPGSDGHTSEFFKSAWSVIGNDFIAAIKSFFVKGFLPKGVNSTILALIPKKIAAKEMNDYRPISCCNVLYKVISKLLANRLKSVLPHLISWNQSAFVEDRLLMENVLLATKLVKDYHKESISPRSAMQIDISKAFDSVQWDFVLTTLAALNFPEKFIHWIKLCISTASFSIQVNGELAGYFNSKRGLRQGCSLSPYLFVICMNVLSKMIDKAAAEGRIGYHPKCKILRITHLCFADDLMVFVDGQRNSILETLKVFEEFAVRSGLKISVEKSTLFLAGITTQNRNAITEQFCFNTGQLPVRYLGLPLMTKRITKADYGTLIDKIRDRMSSWTARHLSYAGRLQLLRSIIASMVNFWLAAYRLPNGCIDEIERLCASFLWSGPELNSRKSKVAWNDVCRLKIEGGLGLRSLKEANKVSCLKLIWRIASKQPSLWVTWIQRMLLGDGSLWSAKESTLKGSWMWKKILKYREGAKKLHKVKVNNGASTSFWFDSWSSIGRIYDTTGQRGFIATGISANETVEQVLNTQRRRRHRTNTLNDIEAAINTARRNKNDEHNQSLWRDAGEKYKDNFSSKETWKQIRRVHATNVVYKGVWFQHETPKYSFFVWLAALNRLSTGDRMRIWNIGIQTTCVLCNQAEETRNHLFFACRYSSEIWRHLSQKLLGTDFTSEWDDLMCLLQEPRFDRINTFLLRYVFQSTLYHVWKERNGRRHGEAQTSTTRIIKTIDRNVRNRLCSIRILGDAKYEDGLSRWFVVHPQT